MTQSGSRVKGSPEPALAVKSVARSRHRNTRGSPVSAPVSTIPPDAFDDSDADRTPPPPREAFSFPASRRVSGSDQCESASPSIG